MSGPLFSLSKDIGENWSEYEGLYVYSTDYDSYYYYKINGQYYNAINLRRCNDQEDISLGVDEMDDIKIYTNGSKILLIELECTGGLLYQKLANGKFIELTPFQKGEDGEEPPSGYIESITQLLVPLSGGKEINGIFENLPLSDVNVDIISRLFDDRIYNEDEILSILNSDSAPASSV